MEWATIIGVLIGGIATLSGGVLQARWTEKAASNQRILDEKVTILKMLMAARVALKDTQSVKLFGVEFMDVINSLDIAFRNNSDVLRKYSAFKNYVNSANPNIDRIMVLLHELACSMYIDVGMEPPSIDEFKSVVSLRGISD